MPRLPRSRPARNLGLAAVLVLGLASAACGDDDDDSAQSPTTAATTPEDVKAPMEEVLGQLPVMVDHGDEAAAAAADGDFEAAAQQYDELHEIWEAIEGTIKDTDADIYERIETAQGLILDGAENENAERVQQGADDEREAVEAFVAANGS